MTNEEDVRLRVERAISNLRHESGLPLAIVMGEKIVRLEDRVVQQIMASQDPETSKLLPTAYVSEEIVHGNFGSFVGGPDGPLRVRLRE
jgi:hypothetical protein